MATDATEGNMHDVTVISTIADFQLILDMQLGLDVLVCGFSAEDVELRSTLVAALLC